ncbi:MAG: hypothetical protein ACQESF_04625 [Nanobdellota archaeon]
MAFEDSTHKIYSPEIVNQISMLEIENSYRNKLNRKQFTKRPYKESLKPV